MTPPPGGDQLTILHSRPLADFRILQSDLLGADRRAAELFLRLVQASVAVRGREDRLLDVVAENTFLAFPQATHQVLAVMEPGAETLEILSARSRDGAHPEVALSTTLGKRVISEGVSLIYARASERAESSESLTLSRISNALCAPLSGPSGTFGIIQLDVRGSRGGVFTPKDLDRLAVYAHYVALVLENDRLYREQQRAFESTIHALVRSLSLKDPDTAEHSVRVRSVALLLGGAMGLEGPGLESLGVAALLHDVGKHGVRDEVLLKPARLSDGERHEMARHASHTEDILDKIRYPRHLMDVPLYAAYHHEKIDGSGPYGLAGEGIPIQARILSVSDAFDALLSPRVYKAPKPPDEVLALLERGRGKEWDAGVLDTLRRTLPRILLEVYGREERPSGDADALQAA